MSAQNTLDIKLMGREFRVVCPPGEREALLAAAALLEGEMAKIAAATKSTGERLAVMAALNLAYQINAFKAPSAAVDASDFKRRISAMEARLDAALASQDDLF
ncbi:MAG TPA: cell division protein ZapA [Rhodocyclaceae bacterium]|nr:cell division protein ZapA [Rhodocyclaceae bacterium]